MAKLQKKLAPTALNRAGVRALEDSAILGCTIETGVQIWLSGEARGKGLWPAVEKQPENKWIISPWRTHATLPCKLDVLSMLSKKYSIRRDLAEQSGLISNDRGVLMGKGLLNIEYCTCGSFLSERKSIDFVVCSCQSPGVSFFFFLSQNRGPCSFLLWILCLVS